jgi:magnesium-transporting ATPase (P-type)
MTIELTVVAGISVITAVFAYMTFNFWGMEGAEENGMDWNRRLALLFLILTVFFVDMLMYTVYLVAANNASLAYLQDGVLLVGLGAVMWITLACLVIYVLMLTFSGLYFLFDFVKMKKNGRSRRKSDDE